jgi:hypothetical protein
MPKAAILAGLFVPVSARAVIWITVAGVVERISGSENFRSSPQKDLQIFVRVKGRQQAHPRLQEHEAGMRGAPAQAGGQRLPNPVSIHWSSQLSRKRGVTQAISETTCLSSSLT